MNFNAKSVRKHQTKALESELNNIVETHMTRIKHLIQFYKQNKQLIYTVESFLPGSPTYNRNIVTKLLARKLTKEGYGCKINTVDNQLLISWRLNDHDGIKKYIQCLLNQIYKDIKGAIAEHRTMIYFIVPGNALYPFEKVVYYLECILVKKKFKVSREGNTFSISW